jgi:hypothetical protein
VKTHALILLVTITGFAAPSAAQDPPPAAPPPPVSQPATQPPSTTPPSAPSPAAVPSPNPVAEAAPGPPSLSRDEVRRRLDAIYVMEGTLTASVTLAARQTASEIQRFQPGLVMFSSAPVKAHGMYLEGYGVVFHVEIPRVMPSVASLVETLQRDAMNRERQTANPAAQRTGIAGASSDVLLNPDAHYVQSVKNELINAMVKNSQSLDLRVDETLIVSARDGSEMPGQVAPPSTMTLQVKGRDLAEFTAGRISLNEIIRRVSVRGF